MPRNAIIALTQWSVSASCWAISTAPPVSHQPSAHAASRFNSAAEAFARANRRALKTAASTSDSAPSTGGLNSTSGVGE